MYDGYFNDCPGAILAILVLSLIVFIIVVYRFVPGEHSGYKGYVLTKSVTTEEVLQPSGRRRPTTKAHRAVPHHLRPTRKGILPGKMEDPKERKADAAKITLTREYQPAKTVWDWQQLLIIPFVLALVTVGFSLVQNAHSERLATDQRQQTTLENYINRMSDLLLNKGSTSTLLHDSKKSDEVRHVAQALTLLAVSRLDPERKRAVVFFLYNADLITWHQWPNTAGSDFPIVDLSTADLEKADLSNIFLNNAYLYNSLLNNANLSQAILDIANLGASNLSRADLSEAQLRGANLANADLPGANLSGAHLETYPLKDVPPGAQRVTNLRGANLTEADLSGANLRGANLSGADLKGATMPDGSKHP